MGGSQAITAAIFGVIVLVLAFILYTPLVGAMDSLILYWSDSCEYSNQRYVRAYVGVDNVSGASPSNVYDTKTQRFYGSGNAVTAMTSGGCQIATVASSNLPVFASSATTGDGAVTASLYNERAQKIGTVSTTATQFRGTGGAINPSTASSFTGVHQWMTVPSLLGQFGGIGRLILSVQPIVVLVAYLGTAGMGLIQYGRGLASGGIVNAVGGAVMSLIVQVVILQILPTVLDAIIGGARVTGGQYTVTNTFSSVIEIVFSAIPILLVVSLLGASAWQLQSQFRSFKGSGAMGSMGM